MRAAACCVLALLLVAPAGLRAEPFWCPPGRDSVDAHPLRYETLKPALDAATTEVAELRLVETSLEEHLLVVPDARAQAESISAFHRLMDILLDVDGSRFLDTEIFRFERLYAAGVAAEPCSTTPAELRSSRPALLAVYMAAETVTLIGRKHSLAGGSVGRRIAGLYSEYEAWLLTGGLPQWPWELWLNGKLVSRDIRESPPLHQWIMARPSAGIDLSYPSEEDADVIPAFGLELLGIVRYRDRSYRKHYGAALFAAIGSEEGAGYGITLRWNGWWAGFVFRPGDRPDGLFLGVDLYRLLRDEGERSELAKDFTDEVFPVFRDISGDRQ